MRNSPSSSIDFAGLRRQVRIEDVLRHFGGRIPPGAGRREVWVPMVCPFCDDTNRSASVNVAAQRFLCHQCGAPREGVAGDVVDIAIWTGHAQTITDGVRWLCRTFLR